jgi:hypothetical protein
VTGASTTLSVSSRRPRIKGEADVDRDDEQSRNQLLQVIRRDEPVGLPIELERGTEGRYDSDYGQREAGAWLYRVKPK